MSEKSKEAELSDIKVIYLGRMETSANKPGDMMIPVKLFNEMDINADVVENLASLFETKRSAPRRAIGSVYTIRGILSPDGRLQTWVRDSFKWCGDDSPMPDEMTAKFEAKTRAMEVARRAAKLEKEALSDGKLVGQLKALKMRYSATDKIGRLALEVVLLDVLRNH